ncbi:MAG: general secretion pathway protein GspK [Chthoniobacterales bacterium]
MPQRASNNCDSRLRENDVRTALPASAGMTCELQLRSNGSGCQLTTDNRQLALRSNAFALPMVLWAIAFLAGLIILVAGSVSSWLDEESHAERLFHARQLALSGLAIGMNPNIRPNDPALTQGDPTDKEGESFSVHLNNESGFINPNTWLAKSDRVIFQRLFEKWGVSQKDQETAIDGLYDWQSRTELRSAHGAKQAEYEKHGLEGYPPNAPFVHAREMGMVIGFASVVKANPKWEHYFSTFNPGKININYCSPEMFIDLLGLTPQQTEAFVKLCAGPDGISGTEDDLIFNDINQAAKLMGVSGLQEQLLLNYFGVTGNIRRIDSKGIYHGITHHIVVIIGDSQGGSMLSWQEQ